MWSLCESPKLCSIHLQSVSSVKATLSLLLDHLSLVASFSPSNRMTHQNLAVCFGPVLLTPTQEAWRAGGGAAGVGGVMKGLGHNEEIASAVDFKRHIEALHYLLQLWPGENDFSLSGPKALHQGPPLAFVYLFQCRRIESQQATTSPAIRQLLTETSVPPPST